MQYGRPLGDLRVMVLGWDKGRLALLGAAAWRRVQRATGSIVIHGVLRVRIFMFLYILVKKWSREGVERPLRDGVAKG